MYLRILIFFFIIDFSPSLSSHFQKIWFKLLNPRLIIPVGIQKNVLQQRWRKRFGDARLSSGQTDTLETLKTQFLSETEMDKKTT